MKKILLTFLTLSLSLSLVACGNDKSTASNNQGSEQNNQNELVSTNLKKEDLISLEDALKELGLEKQPTSIATTSNASTNLALKLDLPIVAATETSIKANESLKDVLSTGTAHTPNYENIVMSKADVVLFEYMFKDKLNDVITEQNIKAYFPNINLYDSIAKEVEILGVAFGKEEKALEIINDYNTRKAEILKSIEDKEAPNVMVLFGSTDSFMIATENTFVGDLTKMLGAKNIASTMGYTSEESSTGFLPISDESAVAANPDYILCLGHGGEEMQKLFEEKFTNNPIWQSTNAIKNNNIVFLDSTLFGTNGGIHAIDSLEELAKILYK